MQIEGAKYKQQRNVNLRSFKDRTVLIKLNVHQRQRFNI